MLISSRGSLQSLDWNGLVEWVLQGEESLLMQFSMKATVAVLFLSLLGNKGPEGSPTIQDLTVAYRT